MKGDTRGPILLEVTLVFGILTIVVVSLRIGFRLYRRWTDLSDWCLAVALVPISLSLSLHPYYLTVKSARSVRLSSCIYIISAKTTDDKQISSICQEAFNVAGKRRGPPDPVISAAPLESLQLQAHIYLS